MIPNIKPKLLNNFSQFLVETPLAERTDLNLYVDRSDSALDADLCVINTHMNKMCKTHEWSDNF